MRILFFGDVFGRPGRQAVKKFIAEKRDELFIDLIIADADNISSGKGPIEKTYNELISGGVDILTCGDHIWDNKDVGDILINDSKLIRPLNYPEVCPGRGYAKINVKGQDVLIVSLLGRVFTAEGLESPFVALEKVLQENKEKIIFIDLHAEATSEKRAIAQHFAGRVSAICGTHTHVQTADEEIMADKTAYISDVGMCGPHDSVIGVDKQQSIKRFLTAMPRTFDVAEGPAQVNAVIVDINDSGEAVSIERINEIES